MAVKLTSLRLSNDDDDYTVEGVITLTGSYVSGGDAVDFSKIVFPPGQLLPATLIPVYAVAQGSTGIDYCFILTGKTLTTCLLKANTTANTEYSAGAYAAAELADTNIGFMARFAKQQ